MLLVFDLFFPILNYLLTITQIAAFFSIPSMGILYHLDL